MYTKYVSNAPRNSCLSIVVVVAFNASVVLLYNYIMMAEMRKLKDKNLLSGAETIARDVILLAKKKHVRYISHEMRTPLNVA